jgi:RND family efflux transporter MFP subunit
MNGNVDRERVEVAKVGNSTTPQFKIRIAAASSLVALIVGGALVAHRSMSQKNTESAAHALPEVAISKPLQQELSPRIRFLGQFSAVQRVEVRAQVGGTLMQIYFKDGDIVHKGDLLFEIDPVPYQIKLSEADAEWKNSTAQLELASRQLVRAQTLKETDAGSAENVEQRLADKRSAEAAVEHAEAMVRDARFDLDHCRITAPFTGRIGTHLVSVGNLIAGSRAAASPTTLLATLVSLNPIYLNFDMSESDYLTFLRDRSGETGELADQVRVSLSDENTFDRHGILNFVDNSLDHSSGTIHARATVPNDDLLLTPGGFARVQLPLTRRSKMLLVPDSAVLPDQSDHIVLVVSHDDVVKPKTVEIGDLRGGLRVIRSGISPDDEVIIDGIPAAVPGSKVAPHHASISVVTDPGRS